MKSKILITLFAVVLVAAACNKGTQQTTNTPAENNSTTDNSGQSITPPPSETPTQTPPGTETPSQTPPSAAAAVMVHMTSAGFSPSSITVKSGTKVTFVNDDTVGHWPASDPHPTHTDLPGFDAKQTVVPGSSYSFTFTKVGTWTYHDHLKSSNRGTVVVQ